MFDTLVGNEQVKAVIRRLMKGGRVPNSLLFAGDEGVGKRQFAFEIARAFVCTSPVDLTACHVCSACKRVDKIVLPTSDKGEDFDRIFFSEHPDVGTVVPFKRNVRIGSIRALEREANFNPYEAAARFFIVDAAEKMADPAANALLKTLEEPPPTTHIFLITSRPDSLLPTIRSRCQMLRFAPVETDKIERYLIDQRAFTHDEARIAARLSRGSIGRAVSINVEKFRARRERMLTVLRSAIGNIDRAELLRISEEMQDAKNKDSFEENLEIIETLIHDVWLLKISGDPANLVNTDEAEALSDLAKSAPGDLPNWLAMTEKLRQDLAVNINRKVATDALFVAMAG